MCVFVCKSVGSEDPSRESIAKFLQVSIGDSSVVNPRDQHPVAVLPVMQWSIGEILVQQAEVKHSPSTKIKINKLTKT